MKEFLNRLPLKANAKIKKWIKELEEHGPNLPRPFADTLCGKIRELRVVFASQHYRCLYFFAQKKIIITHAFIKKTDAVPRSEIAYAERIMNEFDRRIKTGDISYETD